MNQYIYFIYIYIHILFCIYIYYIYIYIYIYIKNANFKCKRSIYIYIYIYILYITKFRDLQTNLHKTIILGTILLTIKVNPHIYEVLIANSLIFRLKSKIHNWSCLILCLIMHFTTIMWHHRTRYEKIKLLWTYMYVSDLFITIRLFNKNTI